MDSTPQQPTPKRRPIRRWLLGSLAILVLGLVAIIVALPWLIGRPAVKAELSRRVNEFFAPGQVAFDEIDVSWFGPSSLTKFALIDSEGRPVVSAPRATVDWSLYEILFVRPKVANVTLDRAKADVIHLGNGKTNLVETLRPVLIPRPKHTVNIQISEGAFQFRSSPKAAPIAGDSADVKLGLTAYPEPITWDVKLAQRTVKVGDKSGQFAFTGKVDRGETGPTDIELALSVEDWNAAIEPVRKAKVGGSVQVSRRQERWSSTGKLALSQLEVVEHAAQGLPNRLERAQADWMIAQNATGWAVESLHLETPFATLDTKGTVERKDGAPWDLGLEVLLSGLDLPDPQDPSKRLQDPLKTAIKLTYDPQKDRVDLADLDLGLPLVRIRGGGSMVDLASQRTLDLNGTLEPDWPSLNKLLVEKVEPKAQLSGGSREWKLRGSLASLDANELKRNLQAEAGIEIDLLDIYGMRLDKTEIVGKFQDGKFTLDPIDSTLNGGPLHLEPELIVDETGHRSLKLGQASHLIEAQVNEEVSHRVLSYVAPVLDQATRVSGTISMEISEAIFPLGTPAEGVKPKVEGDISFENVEFAPGPFADMIFDVLFRERRQNLVLNEPVSLTVMDGRVYQEGLVIPVGKLGELGMNGSVGFDRTLDLTASLTLTPERTGANIPVLNSIIQGTRFSFPIKGTFDKPKLDTKALGEHFKDMGVGLLSRTLSSATGGIIGDVETLKNLFGGGRRRDPEGGQPGVGTDRSPAPPPAPGLDVPPPPKPGIDDARAETKTDEAVAAPKPRLTPEERKTRRLERRLERMRKRGQTP